MTSFKSFGLAVLAFALSTPAAAQSRTAIGDADRALAREVIEELIGLKSAKGRGQTPAVVDALSRRFIAAGFTPADIQTVPVQIDGETAVGLVVRYRGTGRSGRKPIALLGHMDVVDAVTENWATDPYKPVEKDGYLYGRGSVDNKAGVTLISTTFMRLKKAGWTPDRDLVIAFSGDEETGMQTTRALVRHPWVREAEFALNGDAGIGRIDADGSNPVFAIQSAEKTTATFHLTATNPGGHSSAPRIDNAIYDIGKAIVAVQRLRFPVQFNEITRVMVGDLIARSAAPYGRALTALLANPKDAAARAVAEPEVESALLWTTCVPTMLSGGNAFNALPQNATVTVNCRIFPGTPVAQVQSMIETAVANPKLKLSLVGEAVESDVSPVREDLFSAIRRAVHVNYPGAPVKPSMSSGGTDGREFRRAGIPTYGAGSLALVHPDDNRAHGTDERLPLAAFYKELAFWETLLKDVGGPARQR